ncbi:MAG: class I SAM-dependent methyltransferase [Actinomycetota bacterium]
MSTVPLPPQELRFMREDDERFVRVGDESVEDLRKRAGLDEGSVVVDIGCGYGRLAHALLRWPEFRGRYIGLDILPKHIDWCARELAPLRDGFTFTCIDVKNDRYNPRGSVKGARVKLPVPSGSADVVAMFSVFTHLYPDDVVHYIAEVARLLKADGKAYLTFLLLNDEWRARAERDEPAYPLPHELTSFCRYMSADDPLHAIAYDEAWVQDQLEGAGLSPTVEHGSWTGREGSSSFQDTVVAEPAPRAQRARGWLRRPR